MKKFLIFVFCFLVLNAFGANTVTYYNSSNLKFANTNILGSNLVSGVGAMVSRTNNGQWAVHSRVGVAPGVNVTVDTNILAGTITYTVNASLIGGFATKDDVTNITVIIVASSNYVTASITNGFATTNYSQSLTNPMATTNYAAMLASNRVAVAAGTNVVVTTNASAGKIVYTVNSTAVGAGGNVYLASNQTFTGVNTFDTNVVVGGSVTVGQDVLATAGGTNITFGAVNSVNVARRATAGLGTSNSAWTGWEFAQPTDNKDVEYFFPKGWYSSTGIVINPALSPFSKVRMRGEAGTVVRFTGAAAPVGTSNWVDTSFGIAFINTNNNTFNFQDHQGYRLRT